MLIDWIYWKKILSTKIKFGTELHNFKQVKLYQKTSYQSDKIKHQIDLLIKK